MRSGMMVARNHSMELWRDAAGEHTGMQVPAWPEMIMEMEDMRAAGSFWPPFIYVIIFVSAFQQKKVVPRLCERNLPCGVWKGSWHYGMCRRDLHCGVCGGVALCECAKGRNLPCRVRKRILYCGCTEGRICLAEYAKGRNLPCGVRERIDSRKRETYNEG